MADPDTQPLSGDTLTAVSTALVQLFRDHYGRGPTKAKTYVDDDLLVCVLREAGSTPFEDTLARNGGEARVLGLRRVLQATLKPVAMQEVAKITGREVKGVLYDSLLDPDLTVLAFMLGDGSPDT